MTEQELRALVRDAIAKSGIGQTVHHTGLSGSSAPVTGHSSHALFMLAPGDPEGRCIIEPGVACNHCGYCKSYGH
jgi:hypothetical protein